MNEIEQAFFEAVLADIVYVDDLDPDMEVGEFAAAIKFRVSEPLAKLISERFEVLAVESDPDSDYQGVVFRDKTTTIRRKSTWFWRGCSGRRLVVAQRQAESTGLVVFDQDSVIGAIANQQALLAVAV
jgi:hypothetical protein